MKVTVYTKPNCVQCDATKRWLTKNDIPFETKDIMEDPELTQQFVDQGFMSAPVVTTDHDAWSGFRVSKLEGLVKGKKWTIKANWRSNTHDDVAIYFDEFKIPLGLCPEYAYKAMIKEAIENRKNNDYWLTQYEQDLWIHKKINL